MQRYDLCGTWAVRKKHDADTMPATVPGCIHTDLLAVGKIENPYYRDNEDRQMWIGETDWVYTRSFVVEQAFLNYESVLLRCDGLDTLTTITLNGIVIGRTNNQFRTWEFDVKAVLQVGENTIEFCFESTIPFITAAQQHRYLNQTGIGHHRIDGGNRIRKSQCNYGWDWGPMCVTAGIWRPIGLIAFQTARIADVHITQDHSAPDVVGLHVAVQIGRFPMREISPERFPLLHAQLVIRYDQEEVCRAAIDLPETSGEMTVRLEQPQRWWPNGLGAQPLYEITLELVSEHASLDTITKRIGLRTLTLDRHADQWGESFQFVVNGIPFFAKGANWIPSDTFVTRISRAQYDHLIKSAADAHINMLRVWGGGIYEDDTFYDLCDQYGICLWQDFMFACSAYPAFDKAFLENVKHEATDNIRRLRHHPSLTLWCGNNEIEQLQRMFLGEAYEGKMTWTEYQTLFDDLLPALVREHDPERPYWPSSPHTPIGERTDANNPTCGDAHLWEVWHGRQPFEWYHACDHRFNSEFGFQSFPEPAVVASYTTAEDRNITSYIMERHQRSQIGNDAIIQYMLAWFKLPTNFDMLLWLSQILQGMAMKYAVEHWRRSMPRGMGTLYWQLNDCWPVASWSSIDYEGNWKALHYMARDFFAPLLISGIEDAHKGTVEVHVTSDLEQEQSGVIQWLLTDTSGALLAQNTLDCTIPPRADRKVMELHCTDHLAAYGHRRLLLWLELLIDGQIASHNLIYFARPKHLELLTPEITTTIQAKDGQTFDVTLTASHPALWVWLDMPGVKATYSHRFLHLRPGKVITVTVRPATPMSPEEFEQKLFVNSLMDTWTP